MLWNKARRSDNVEDARAGRQTRTLSANKLGLGLGAIALAGIGLYAGVNPPVDQIRPDVAPIEVLDSPAVPVAEDTRLAFVESVLGDTEDTWRPIFEQLGKRYPEPTLTLFDNGVVSGCGFASSASGPFYCPQDQQLYLDLEFFREMAQRYAVVGDFAQAYVIAHEVGHHVQTVLGLTQALDDALDADQPVAGANGLEVRSELQADCLAGVWAHHAQQRLNWLEPGDIEEALHAAAVFGDDYTQRNPNRAQSPETFSHGTSAQRAQWFQSGFAEGRISQCDTFAADL
jgi:predicted metalloprotease